MDTLTGVLNLSKLEAGEMNLGAGPVDLAEQAEKIAEELRPQAEGKGLALRVETGEGPIRARADAGGVQIVLRNLMSNAIKYTEEGEVRVRAYRKNSEAAWRSRIPASGWPPPGPRTSSSRSGRQFEGLARDYEGTGLGLAVTKEAAEQMGGRVEVETKEGKGTCVTVRLPTPSRTND